MEGSSGPDTLVVGPEPIGRREPRKALMTKTSVFAAKTRCKADALRLPESVVKVPIV